jgi:hypothetical protein
LAHQILPNTQLLNDQNSNPDFFNVFSLDSFPSLSEQRPIVQSSSFNTSRPVMNGLENQNKINFDNIRQFPIQESSFSEDASKKLKTVF